MISRTPTTKEKLSPKEREKLGLQKLHPPVERSRPPIGRWLVLAMVVLFLALGSIVAAGVLGYLDGLRDREEYLRTQALEHYRLGVIRLRNEEYELAQAEFEEALRLQPDLQPAWDKLREARMRQGMLPTPTSIPLPTVMPTPTPPEAREDERALLLNEARSLYEKGDYAGALSRLESLRARYPQYESERITELLFDCYYRQGLALVQEDRLEEALRAFDRALQWRPDHAEAQAERELAAEYLTALGYWGADWPAAIAHFSALYEKKPDYKDVAERLFNAHVEYANSLVEHEQWCESIEWYDKALQMRTIPTLADKRQQASEACSRAMATSTAEAGPPATPTSAATEQPTSIVSQDALKALKLAGTLYYAVRDDILREYVIYRINADGTGLARVIVGMHQPQVNRAGTHLVARARSGVPTLGLYLIDVTSGDPPAVSMITSHVDDLYPSFSPNGQQVVFASNRMSQRLWTLFTTWVDGKSELQTVTEGHTPAWSPVGDRIVYKGCDERGNNCGLYTVGSDGSEKRAVLMDPSAGFPAWSPDGERIAFMSNRDGNWEIYLVGADGQGLRRLTKSASSEGLPAWSPDGQAVAYVSDRDGQWGIYLHRVDDGRVAKLISLETTYEDWLMEKITWGPAR